MSAEDKILESFRVGMEISFYAEDLNSLAYRDVEVKGLPGKIPACVLLRVLGFKPGDFLQMFNKAAKDAQTFADLGVFELREEKFMILARKIGARIKVYVGNDNKRGDEKGETLKFVVEPEVAA